jgi:hypothetical protein
MDRWLAARGVERRSINELVVIISLKFITGFFAQFFSVERAGGPFYFTNAGRFHGRYIFR